MQHSWKLILAAALAVVAAPATAAEPFERPSVIRFGAHTAELQTALAGQCASLTIRRIDPPFLPAIKDKQTQIDCEGFAFRGSPRHVEFVIGDDTLQMVWLMLTPAEMDATRDAMQARYGAPTHSNAAYVAFEHDGAALRPGKAEILFYAPQLQAAMDPDFSGAVYADRAAWAADLDALYAEMQAKHPDLYRRHGKAEWDARHAALHAAILRLDWPHFVVALHRFVALAGDGHTNLLSTDIAGPGFDTRYNVRFGLFWDGLYVLSASSDIRQAIGGRVLAVNGHPIAAVARALAGLTGHDSPMWAANWVPLLLSYPGNVAGLDFGTLGAPLRLTLKTMDGKTIDVAVPFSITENPPKRLTVFDVLHNGHTLPAWWSPDAPLTFDYRPDSKTVYAVFGSVADGDTQTLKQLSDALYAFVAAHDTQRLIFDVRNNGGGDNTLLAPLIDGAKAFEAGHPGGLYVIIGRQTFSAAENFVTRMERRTGALFAGEPTGESPNQDGEPEVYHLPRTLLPVLISTRRWDESDPADRRSATLPDLPAHLNFAQFANGRDPALEAALAYDPSRAPAQTGPRWKRASQHAAWGKPLP